MTAHESKIVTRSRLVRRFRGTMQREIEPMQVRERLHDDGSVERIDQDALQGFAKQARSVDFHHDGTVVFHLPTNEPLEAREYIGGIP